MPEPVSSPESEHVETVANAMRDLSDGATRYLGHLRAYLGMSRSDLDALRLIASHCAEGDPLSPSELARKLGLSNAATSALLDRLEEADHIDRELVEGDRRRRRITIHDQSAQLAEDMFAPLDGRVSEALSEFDAAELALIAQGFDRLAQAVTDANEEVGAPDFVLPTDEDAFPF